MNRLPLLALVASTLLIGAAPLSAQQKRISPPDITSASIDGNRVTVWYSRPYTKDPNTGAPRKIWGGLVPYGKVWRTGANEATLLVTQKTIEMGRTTVPAGAYTLFMQPEADGPAKLILSKQIGQWGLQYDPKQDFARIPLKKDALKAPLDQLLLSIERNPDGGGILKIMWEDTQYSVTYMVKK